MKALRLTLSLAFFVPCLALLGMFAAADRRFSAWGGAVVGGLLGVYFGLAFGGNAAAVGPRRGERRSGAVIGPTRAAGRFAGENPRPADDIGGSLANMVGRPAHRRRAAFSFPLAPAAAETP
jgi:hypothetical protein